MASRHLLLALGGLLAAAPRVHAEETPLLVAGAAFESPSPTLAPLLALRWPLADDRTLIVSQLGWTSGLALEVPTEPDLRWRSSVELTPLRARLSHDVYDQSGEHARPSAAFDDTSLRFASGPEWDLTSKDDRSLDLGLALHAVFDQEFVEDSRRWTRPVFDTPFFGLEASFVLDHTRWREPLGGRIDGARLELRTQSLHGAAPWRSAQLIAALGLRSHALFAGLRATAFAVDFDTKVTRFVLGGSWDWLGESAVVGYPLGAFRLARGAAATGALDLSIAGRVELGVRQSVVVGADRVQGGSALLLQAELSGIRVFVGVGIPDRALGSGRFESLVCFAGLRGAVFFLA